jgi:hypothetical protein
MRITFVLAGVGLVGWLGLIGGGCGTPALTPEQMAEQARTTVHCRRCIEQNCVAEANACETDSLRALHEDGGRCLCLLGCRRIGHNGAEACARHCGSDDAAYNALSACMNSNCPRCPEEPSP